MYCIRKEGIYPVKKWNKDEIIHFCEEHYKEAEKYEEANGIQFYNHYLNEGARKILPERSLKLWNEVHEEMQK
jgi:hypothetical protein